MPPVCEEREMPGMSEAENVLPPFSSTAEFRPRSISAGFAGHAGRLDGKDALRSVGSPRSLPALTGAGTA